MQTKPFNEVFAVLVRQIGRERSAAICGVSLKCITNWCGGNTTPNEATQAGAVALLLTVCDLEEDSYEHTHAQKFIENRVFVATKC